MNPMIIRFSSFSSFSFSFWQTILQKDLMNQSSLQYLTPVSSNYRHSINALILQIKFWIHLQFLSSYLLFIHLLVFILSTLPLAQFFLDRFSTNFQDFLSPPRSSRLSIFSRNSKHELTVADLDLLLFY